MALPPRRSASTDINAGYADKIPALPGIQPWERQPANKLARCTRSRVPLVTGGEDVAESDGLVGHNAVDAQVEQPFHGRAVVDGPRVDLHAQRLGAAEERRGAHRGTPPDTADPAARQPVGQRPPPTRRGPPAPAPRGAAPGGGGGGAGGGPPWRAPGRAGRARAPGRAAPSRCRTATRPCTPAGRGHGGWPGAGSPRTTPGRPGPRRSCAAAPRAAARSPGRPSHRG